MNLVRPLFFVLACATAPLFAAEGWSTDHKATHDQARAEKKLLLLNFTGSDWCVWCHRLRDEVFATKAFKDYAAKHLVLLEVDFPRSKPQSAELKKANQALQKKYGVRGYPTIIVLNSEGKQAGELGYMEGGPKAFLAELDKLRK